MEGGQGEQGSGVKGGGGGSGEGRVGGGTGPGWLRHVQCMPPRGLESSST